MIFKLHIFLTAGMEQDGTDLIHLLKKLNFKIIVI
jgi:hypothetical protein